MKTFLSFLVLVALGVGLWWWGENNNMGGKAVETPAQPIELCFAKFEDSPDSEFEDKYTLRMNLAGEKVSGELRMLPAEKDALIGGFEGMVTPIDPATMSRTADLIWNTEGEGMTAKQELKIIFGEGTASVGFGEMAAREDGVYVYKDPAKVDYSFTLSDFACTDLNEREAVEKMLWENITTLSPVAPVLGGTWYVVSAAIDLEKNSGTVVYEDGHVQEKRNFSYALDAEGRVELMTIE